MKTTSKEQAVLDNLRLSLELLMRAVLGNSKSLEKQKEALGPYLKSKGTSTDITNIFHPILTYYCHYQNDNAKHGDSSKLEEVEFMLYQTGTLMRFLITR